MSRLPFVSILGRLSRNQVRSSPVLRKSGSVVPNISNGRFTGIYDLYTVSNILKARENRERFRDQVGVKKESLRTRPYGVWVFVISKEK